MVVENVSINRSLESSPCPSQLSDGLYEDTNARDGKVLVINRCLDPIAPFILLWHGCTPKAFDAVGIRAFKGNWVEIESFTMTITK